jgi:hypothetical protein
VTDALPGRPSPLGAAPRDGGGPSLCFRGLDNTAYYRLRPRHPDRYYDTTGTGNSLNAGNRVALRLIMDSLRYWLTEMHEPDHRPGLEWVAEIDSYDPASAAPGVRAYRRAGERVTVGPRSVLVLRGPRTSASALGPKAEGEASATGERDGRD